MFAQANALGHDRQDGLGIGLSLARSLVNCTAAPDRAQCRHRPGQLFTVDCRSHAGNRLRDPRRRRQRRPKASRTLAQAAAQRHAAAASAYWWWTTTWTSPTP
jgi:K+-sensing histidine kinase KdpD